MNTKHPCPVCGGAGFLDEGPRHADRSAEAKQIMAKALRAKGYSLRQIANLVGWKSVRSAHVAVSPDKRERKK